MTASAKTSINVWGFAGGATGEALQKMCAIYAGEHPDVNVKYLGVGAAPEEKFLTSMVAGRPPDVMITDGTWVVEWATKNLLMPLDEYYKNAKIKPTDFWGPSWKQTLWKGKSYALPWESDGNFPLFYSKGIFGEAGLPGPPKSFSEMELYVDKLNVRDGAGKYTRVGMLPWDAGYWYHNALYTWGWAFGGDFVSADNTKATLTDPKVVAALKWLYDFSQKHDYKNLSAFASKLQIGGKGDPLTTGKVGMMFRTGEVLLTSTLAPKGFELGWGYTPDRFGGKVAWLGGWTFGIPRGSKNAKKAFDFARWACASPQGTELSYKLTGYTPSYKASLAFKNADDKILPFVKVLEIADFQRPVLPITQVYASQMYNAVSLVLGSKKSPIQALTDANKEVQKALDRTLGRLASRK